MSTQRNTSDRPDDTLRVRVARRPTGVPRTFALLVVATMLATTFIAAGRLAQPWLGDRIGLIDQAFVNIASMVVALLVAAAWLGWLWRGSRLPWIWSTGIPVVVVVCGIAGLICYRPVFDGSLAIERWKPRFWGGRTLERVDETRAVELAALSGTDFYQFLGRERNARADEFAGDVLRLPEAELVWRRPVGSGWSGFIAVGNYAWTMQQDGPDEMVVCLDIRTGETCWEHRHARRHDDSLGGPGPRATPTFDENRIYAQGANGLLVCLDAANGEVLWQQDVSRLVDVPLDERVLPNGVKYQQELFYVPWGRSASPLVIGDRVITTGGGPTDGPQASLIAFDKRTGEELWRGGEDPISFSSPAFLQLDGVWQIVVVNQISVAGHDPETGEVLWRHPLVSAYPGQNTSQPTQIGDDRILLTRGYGGGGECIRVQRSPSSAAPKGAEPVNGNGDTSAAGETSQSGDGEWSVEQLWKIARVLRTKLTNPVVHEGYAYGLSEGILECVDLETGDRVWKRGRYGHGQVLGIGDFLLVHAEDGYLVVVEATPDEFREVARLDTIGGICWNTICVTRDLILVRSDTEAACFRLPRKSGRADQGRTGDPGGAGSDAAFAPRVINLRQVSKDARQGIGLLANPSTTNYSGATAV